ncbi:MAG: M23 family metallopeptidase [Bacteroidales bacterium]|nr:M23 family metallopeptidase [Bacteroidales bacterium]MDT8372873.1 M23 family metallopeptidase [Bacteroidales bacterium]
MIKRNLLLVVALTIANLVGSQVSDRDLFVSPLGDAPSLSASFAELRSDHFHSGIDYRTGGVTGKDVMAVDAGYVYRIAVSPGGFGKALYVRHPSGYSSVYAHLRSFRPDIEEYVEKRQYELKSFAVSLFPQRNQFSVERGEVIAWSGNTGGSSGPHLHFELRDSSSEEPVNPLGFDFGVNDSKRPVIDKVILYPLSRNSSVNGRHASLTLKTVPADGSYGIGSSDLPVIAGETGLGIKCWDSFDNSSNRCGIYSIEMLADGLKIYSFTADRFSYSESRYINSHIDYTAKTSTNEYIHRLFIQPGNGLSMYDGHVNRGILSFGDAQDHEIRIIVTDASGNRSWVDFRLRSLPKPVIAPAPTECSKVLPYTRASDFTADGIRIHFPARAFYDTLFFKYDVRSGSRHLLSPIHSLHNETVAVHNRFRLSIRPDTLIPGMEEKLCLARVDRDEKPSYSGGRFSYGYVTADVNRLGDYAVAVDTVSPVIKPSFAKGADLTGKRLFTVTVTDEFSGIGSYETMIDGQWFLAEYDAKNNLLIYRPTSVRLNQNAHHTMELTVTDNRGNSTVLKSEFRW